MQVVTMEITIPEALLCVASDSECQGLIELKAVNSLNPENSMSYSTTGKQLCSA